MPASAPSRLALPIVIGLKPIVSGDTSSVVVTLSGPLTSRSRSAFVSCVAPVSIVAATGPVRRGQIEGVAVRRQFDGLETALRQGELANIGRHVEDGGLHSRR